MANKKLSQLTTKGSLSDTDIIPIVDNVGTKKVTASTVKTYTNSGLSTVATSGSYNDLTNKPTIPTATSGLTNDSGFITSNVSADIIPTTDNTVDLGSPTNRFRHLYVAPGTIYLGDIKLTNNNGKLDAKKVVNPGEDDEEDDVDSDAFSPIKEIAVEELTDVDVSNPQNGQALVWHAGDEKWKNQTVSGGGNANTGDFTFSGTTMAVAPHTMYISAGSSTVEFLGYIDNGFGGTGATLHVTSIISGTITDGMTIFGSALPSEGWTLNFGTVAGDQGTGGVGNYYLPGANYLTEEITFTGEGSKDGQVWAFDGNGKITLPIGGDIVDGSGNSVLGGGSTNEITNSDGGNTYSVSVGTDGVVTMNTARGVLEFGAMPEVGGPSHLHIMKPEIVTGVDLYFGDDYNFVLQRGTAWGQDPAYGVEIGANDRDGGGQKRWRFGTDGNLTLPEGGDIVDSTGTSVLGGGSGNGPFSSITFADGTVQTTAYVTAEQTGYINELVNAGDNNRVDMQAVAMDSDGNSYVSYAYYDDNDSREYGGIVKFNSSGVKQWSKNIASANGDAEYVQIASLEYTELNGASIVVAMGNYYDDGSNKDIGFMYFINADDGSILPGFNTEVQSANNGMEVNDAVFGDDGTGNPFAVMVGTIYDVNLDKTFTPLAPSTVDKLYLSWSEVNASGVQAGEQLYYNVNGWYGFRMNAVDTLASLDGTTNALPYMWLQVSKTEAGQYQLLRVNGWSGDIGQWSSPVNLRVLGSNLGGADGVNDLTFDFNPSVFNYNSNNLAAAVSNISGTPVSDVFCQAWNGKDWSAEIGNTLTFQYQMGNQAYISRLGPNPWVKNLGNANYDRLYSVVVDSSNNSYAVGNMWNGSNRGSLVIKYDIDGIQQWAVYIDPENSTGNDVTSIDILADGNLITVDEEGYVTKIDSDDGSIIWQVEVDQGPSWDANFRGTTTPDGGYIITNYEDDDYTLYVIRLNTADGSVEWTKQISRMWAGNNGEVYPENDFDAQYIDCNSTHVTVAGTTYLNNASPEYAGIVINFPIDGENSNGMYGQYTISSVELESTTQSTTSVAATVNSISSSITAGPGDPSSSTSNLTITANNIGGSASATGDITFDGSKLSSPASGSGDFPLGVITLAPGATSETAYADYGQFINIYPTNAFDSPHIHIAPGSGNNSTGNLILGDDNYHIDINNNGSIYIKTNNQNYSWEFDTNGNLRLPSGGDIKNSSGNSVLGSGLPRAASPTNIQNPDVSCGNIRVMMNSGVITVLSSQGNPLALVYTGRVISASGTQTIIASGASSVDPGQQLTLATLVNRGDTMIIDNLYDANTGDIYRITVMVTWSSLPHGSIIIERIA